MTSPTKTKQIEALTAKQIKALRIDAGNNGDRKLVETCRRAEAGSQCAHEIVAKILASTRNPVFPDRRP